MWLPPPLFLSTPMAISPFKFGAKDFGAKNNGSDRPPPRSSADRLTLPQALTITAGLAGLVGLCSGAIIRFAISNSSNARFLSPLQTFPALSNWTPALPDATESDLPAEASELAEPAAGASSAPFEGRSRSEDAWSEDVWSEDAWSEDSIDTSIDTRSESVYTEDLLVEERVPEQTVAPATDVRTFDTFADRSEPVETGTGDTPLQRLERGPSFGKAYDESNRKGAGDSMEEKGYSESPYAEPYTEPSYLEDTEADVSGRNYYENAYDDPLEEYEYEAPYNSEQQPDSSYFGEE